MARINRTNPRGLSLTGDWDRLRRALDSNKFTRALRRNVVPAMGQSAQELQSRVRRPSGLAPNAALTIMVKGRNDPLRDTGDLLSSVEVKKQGPFRFVIGVSGNSRSARLAEFLHEGGQIPVTDAMRNMFRLLWLASIGKLDPGKLRGRARELYARQPTGWKPLRPTTSVIRIPARPFLRQALEEAGFRRDFRVRLMRSAFKSWRETMGPRGS